MSGFLTDAWWRERVRIHIPNLWCALKGHPATWVTHDSCAALGYHDGSVTGPCEQWCIRCHQTLRTNDECVRGGTSPL